MKPVAYLIEENDLHAYVDNQLSEGRRKAVEAYLNEHQDEAAKVEAYIAQNEILRQMNAQPLQAAPATIHLVNAILEARAARATALPLKSLIQKRLYPSSR